MTRRGRADRPAGPAAQGPEVAMNWGAAALLLAIAALYVGLVALAWTSGNTVILAVLAIAFAAAYGLGRVWR